MRCWYDSDNVILVIIVIIIFYISIVLIEDNNKNNDAITSIEKNEHSLTPLSPEFSLFAYLLYFL